MHVKLNLMILIKITRVDLQIIVILLLLLPLALLGLGVLRSNEGIVAVRIFGSGVVVSRSLREIVVGAVFLVAPRAHLI